MPRIYRFSANVLPQVGFTPDDALAVAVSAVDNLTIIEHSEAGNPVPGVWIVSLDYIGQGTAEALETARQTMGALMNSGYAADSPSLIDMSAPNGRERIPM